MEGASEREWKVDTTRQGGGSGGDETLNPWVTTHKIDRSQE